MNHKRLRNSTVRILNLKGLTVEQIAKEFNTTPEKVQEKLVSLKYLEK